MEPSVSQPVPPSQRSWFPAVGTLLFAVIFGMALSVFCLYFWGAQVAKEQEAQSAKNAIVGS